MAGSASKVGSCSCKEVQTAVRGIKLVLWLLRLRTGLSWRLGDWLGQQRLGADALEVRDLLQTDTISVLWHCNER